MALKKKTAAKKTKKTTATAAKATPPATWAALNRVENVSRLDDCVVVDCGDRNALWLDFPRDGVARVRAVIQGKPLPGASGMVPEPRHPVRGAVEERRGRITVRAPGIEVKIRPEDAGLVFRTGEGHVFLDEIPSGGHLVKAPGVRLIRPRTVGERVYGLGEKAWDLERSGRTWRQWNTDPQPSYQRGTDPLYLNVPFLLFNRISSSRPPGPRLYYGIFFDNPHALRVDLKSRDTWTIEADEGPLEYYVIAGPRPAQVMERFTDLVGRMPLPPRWSLGYHQSRWSYYPDRRVRRLADDFRERDVPCDAIHLDIDHMDGYRVFTWNKKRFPQPARLMRDLGKKGFKVVSIVDPGIKVEKAPLVNQGLKKGHFLKNAAGKPLTARVWPGKVHFPDFTSRHTRRWWGDLHASLVKAGVAGIWNDMNEPCVFGEARTLDSDVPMKGAPGRRDHAANHNLYGALMCEATYRGLRRLRPQARPFVLTRAGFAGVQRHAAVWTGDNRSTWKDLHLSVSMLLGLGVSGIPFCGADVGGFNGTPTPELFTRWMQAAALTPFFRSHTERTTPDQEPWSFGPAAEERVRKAIRLRYRFLPYLYTVFEESTRTGAPVMRPLWWSYPDDPRVQQIQDQFLVGDSLMVAPVLTRGTNQRSVYFPEGTWMAVDDSTVVSGPITRSVKAPMARLPVFVRGGRIVPAREPEPCCESGPLDPLELLVFLDADGAARGTLYEDAGDGFDYQRGQVLRTRYTARRQQGRVTVTAMCEGDFPGVPRAVRIRLVGMEDAKTDSEVRMVDVGTGWQTELLL